MGETKFDGPIQYVYNSFLVNNEVVYFGVVVQAKWNDKVCTIGCINSDAVFFKYYLEYDYFFDYAKVFYKTHINDKQC